MKISGDRFREHLHPAVTRRRTELRPGAKEGLRARQEDAGRPEGGQGRGPRGETAIQKGLPSGVFRTEGQGEEAGIRSDGVQKAARSRLR